MVRADPDALQEWHGSVIQRIANLEQSLCLIREESQPKGDVEAKSLGLIVAKKEVDVKSKILTDLEAVPTLLSDDVRELERHK